MKNSIPPQIEEYYIGYFDILGYKEIMLTENPEAFLKTVHLTIQKALSRVDNFNSILSTTLRMERLVFYKIFSDNIILYYKYEHMYYSNYMLLSFIELIKDIQLNLIYKLNIFIRGSITKGEFTANDTYVFGKALIRAVELEKKAVYPIIVLDNIIVNELKTPVTTINQNDKDFFLQLENALYGIFNDPTPKTLHDRIQNCLNMYFDVIVCASILPQFRNNVTLANMQNHYKQISELSRISLNIAPQQLEKLYAIVKQSKRTMIELAQTVISKRFTQINIYNNDRLLSCIKKMGTRHSFIDYISVLNTEKLIKNFYIDEQEAIAILQENFPEQVDFMDSLMEDIKKDHTSTLKEILLMHRNAIEKQLVKYSGDSKIFLKYEWLRVYHNSLCADNYENFRINDRCWFEIEK